MASLSTLPHEILDEIWSQISYRDIVHVSKTCKALRIATLPAVYQDISIVWYGPYVTKIPALLRTLLENPIYAQYVKNLSFRAVNDPEARKPESFPLTSLGLTSREEGSLVKAAIDEMRLPGPEKWMKAIAQRNYDTGATSSVKNDVGAMIALIIGRCTRLRSLAIDIDFLLHNDWLHTMLQEMIMDHPDIPQLSSGENITEVSIKCPDKYVFGIELPVEIFPILLYLPQLTSLELPVVGLRWQRMYRLFSWPLHVPPVAASLTSLRLSRWSAHPTVVELILKQTPNLKSLTYDGITVKGERAGSELYHLQKLGEALYHVRHTLSSLSLRQDCVLDKRRFPYGRNRLFQGNIGSFVEFTALTDLEISLGMLFNYPGDVLPRLKNYLPPKVQHLTLIQDFPDLGSESVQHVAWAPFLSPGQDPVTVLLQRYAKEDRSTRILQLKSLVIDIHSKNYQRFWEVFRCDFELLFLRAGVSCSVILNGDEKAAWRRPDRIYV